MKWKVLVSAPYMQPVLDRFDEFFRQNRIEVVVPEDQLSLAIGRRGQNMRLASQLTGWDIDNYGFMHLGFQEYLAAREIRTRAFNEPQVLQELGRYQPGRNERRIHDWIVRQRDNPTLRAALIVLTTPNWLRKVQFLFEVALPGPAYMQARYGPGWLPRLYLRRYRNFALNLLRLRSRQSPS